MTETTTDETSVGQSSEALKGGIAAASGYLFWGLTVIFYKQLTAVSAYEVLSHRMIWSVLLTGALVLLLRKGRSLLALMRDKRKLLLLTLTASIIGGNWFVFIYSINESRVLETSLGYFINPLISVLIGVFFLSERLTPPQIVAVVLAAIGVLVMTVDFGTVPWISLFLAVTFAIYGYVRKVINVDPLEGLLVEVLVLLPFGLAYLIWLEGAAGTSFVNGDAWTIFLIIMTGPMTVIPLFLFNYGAIRVRLATLGLMQYAAPTVQFILAVILYGEVLTDTHLITFGLIWAGLALFSWDTWAKERELRRVAARS